MLTWVWWSAADFVLSSSLAFSVSVLSRLSRAHLGFGRRGFCPPTHKDLFFRGAGLTCGLRFEDKESLSVVVEPGSPHATNFRYFLLGDKVNFSSLMAVCSNVCISAVKFPPFGTRVMADDKFDSALEFLLDEKEIPMEYKAQLLDIRINTMSKFAMLDETRAQIRSMLTTEWGFDPSKVPEARGNNASFIDAWETAVTRITKERE